MDEIPGINRSSRPNKFYKYISLQDEERMRRARDIIVNHRLWLSSRTCFNDPFDSRPVFDFDARRADKAAYFTDLHLRKSASISEQDALASALHRIEMSQDEVKRAIEEIQSEIDSKMDRIGICCFSSELSNLLLWGHYADGHRGIAIEMESEKQWDLLDSVRKIEYQAEYPTVRPFTDSPDDILKKSLLVKSDCWEYEKEYRIIGIYNCDEHVEFDPRNLTAVILGSSISEEKARIVTSWIGSLDLRPRLIQSRRARGCYGLEFI